MRVNESGGGVAAQSGPPARGAEAGRGGGPDRTPVRVGAAGNLYPPVEKLIANAQRAEARGYASVWWPDHLMAWHPESLWTEDITPMAALSPTPHVHVDALAAIAAAAVNTERVQLGTVVTEIIRRHPAVLAQEFLTLHHFSHGRAVLGIGAGEGENIIPYGLDFNSPVAKLSEALEIIRLLWESDEPVEFDGRHFRLDRAVLGLGAHEGSFPPIWVAAHGPRMCELTGRLGDGWVPTSLPLADYAEKLSRIRKAAADAGRDPGAIEPSLFTYVVPAADHETAHRLMENALVKGFCLALGEEAFAAAGSAHPLGSGSYGLLEYIPAGLPRADAERLIDAIPFDVVHEYIWHGTPDELATKAREFAEAGLRHLIPWNVAFFADLSGISESFAALDEMTRLLSACPRA